MASDKVRCHREWYMKIEDTEMGKVMLNDGIPPENLYDAFGLLFLTAQGLDQPVKECWENSKGTIIELYGVSKGPAVVMISLGNAISVVTGRMYSKTRMVGIFRTIAAIVRLYDTDFTKEQLKKAVLDVRAEVDRQHPWIRAIELPDDSDVIEWLDIQEAKYGKFIQVFPIDRWTGFEIDVHTYGVPGILSPENRVSKKDLVID